MKDILKCSSLMNPEEVKLGELKGYYFTIKQNENGYEEHSGMDTPRDTHHVYYYDKLEYAISECVKWIYSKICGGHDLSIYFNDNDAKAEIVRLFKRCKYSNLIIPIIESDRIR